MSGAGQSGSVAIHVENLTVRYGQTPGLQGVCLNVRQGEYLGVIGPNGGGKTTLLKAILGLTPITQGDIRILGQPIAQGRCHVGYVPQFSALNKRFPVTVAEVVVSGRIRKGIAPFFRYRKEDWAIAHTMMRRVGIETLSKRQASELSGGEFQKMLIARALATQPEILMLDEPTASVDVASHRYIYDLLDELRTEMTIVLVTHDLFSIASRVDSVACLSNTLLYHGAPTLNATASEAVFGCPVDLQALAAQSRANQMQTAGKEPV